MGIIITVVLILSVYACLLYSRKNLNTIGMARCESGKDYGMNWDLLAPGLFGISDSGMFICLMDRDGQRYVSINTPPYMKRIKRAYMEESPKTQVYNLGSPDANLPNLQSMLLEYEEICKKGSHRKSLEKAPA